MTECTFGWSEEGTLGIVVATVKFHEKRQGVLAVAHQEHSVDSSIKKGLLYLLQKIVSSAPKDAPFVWSVPMYSALCLLHGKSFDDQIQHMLRSFPSVERKEVDNDATDIKAIIHWSKTQLLTENGWKKGEMVGATLQEVKAFSGQQNKKNMPISLPKIQWATLFDIPEQYVAFDLETTGKHPAFARIIEIAGVKVNKGSLSTFHTYVNPQIKLSKTIQELTGITQEQVDQAPYPWQAIRSFLSFVGKAPLLIGHNVKYDISVLNAHCIRFKIPLWKGEVFCTQQEAKQRIAGLPDTRLDTVCQRLHIVNPAPHQALADADSSRLIFEKMFGREQHLLIPMDRFEKIQRVDEH